MRNVGKISYLLAAYLAPLSKANWKVIFLCILTATIFWFFNALNKEYTTRIDYPIEIVFNKDSLVAVKELPDEIPINVTGGGWQLLKKTISVNVDPIIIQPENPVQMQFLTGTNLLPMFSEQLKDLNVNYIATDTIFFQIEPLVKKKIFITVDSANIDLKKNYYIVSQINIEPDTIMFIGPSSKISELSEDFCINLPDKNVDDDYDQELSLDLFSSSLIKKNPEIIHVWFNVDEFIDREASLPIEMANFPYDSSIVLSSERINASFKVQRQYRNDVDLLDFMIIADLNNINPQDSTITFDIAKRPAHITDLSLSPDRLKVVYVR